MAILGKRATFEALKSINSATFTGAYQALGVATTNPAVLMKIVNNSNTTATISFDGVNDHDILPASTFVLYDFGSDAQDVSAGGRLSLPVGQVYVKGAAGVGLVYLVIVYAGG